MRATGLDTALSRALAPWRRPLAVHDPGKIVVDLALCAALGGDHLSDLSLLRCAEEVFGPVASDPTVCRLIKTLAQDADAVEAAVEAARGEVRRRVWSLAGGNAPTAGISAESPLVIDVDATLVEAHSAKEGAAPTFKGGFGYHPLTAWFDHGADGAGQCAAIMLRPGHAGANTAADHIEVISRALDQAGLGSRPGRKVLVRIDGAGGTKETVGFLARRRVSYSVGFKLPDRTPQIYAKIPETAWAPAYNADGDPREGADVAEITGMLDLSGWPEGMRVIMRREKPHPGARLQNAHPRMAVGQVDELPDVHPDPLADEGQLIGKGDVEITKGVLRQLGHLGGGGVGQDQVTPAEGGVQVSGQVAGLGGQAADDPGVGHHLGHDAAGQHAFGAVGQVHLGL